MGPPRRERTIYGTPAGPKKVFTRQAQGYRLERRKALSGGDATGVVMPLDRVVVCQVGFAPSYNVAVKAHPSRSRNRVFRDQPYTLHDSMFEQEIWV